MITYNQDGHAVSFTGESVDVFRMAALVSSLELYATCGLIPTRGVTITKMLQMASEYTGKKYKRGDALKAAAELQVVFEHARDSQVKVTQG